MERQWRHFVVFGGIALVALVVAGCQQQVRPRKPRASVKGLQTVHFDYDRAAIKGESRSALQSNADWMRKHSGTRVAVEGHCDERGSTEYNIALGWRRARSAKNYMVSLGIGSKRLITKSFGEERPVCRQSNESCWWKNRRAEFIKQ